MRRRLRLKGQEPLGQSPPFGVAGRAGGPEGEGNITEVLDSVHFADQTRTRFSRRDASQDRDLGGLVLAGEPDEGDRGVAKTRALEEEPVSAASNSERKEPL